MSANPDPQHPRADNGQFTTTAHAEPAVALAPERPVLTLGAGVDNTDDDDGSSWSAAGIGNTAFDRAVRALLGVTDERRKVTSTSRGGDSGSTYTQESWEEITVSCAGKSADFQTMPELLRALEKAEKTPIPLGHLTAMIYQDVVVTFPGGVTWNARLANAKGHLVLLIGAQRVYLPGGYGYWHHNDRGEWELRVAPDRILSIDVPDPASAEHLARREHDRFVSRTPYPGVPFDDLPAETRRRKVNLYTEQVDRLSAILR